MKKSYNLKNIFILIILGSFNLFTDHLLSQELDQQENRTEKNKIILDPSSHNLSDDQIEGVQIARENLISFSESIKEVYVTSEDKKHLDLILQQYAEKLSNLLPELKCKSLEDFDYNLFTKWLIKNPYEIELKEAVFEIFQVALNDIQAKN